MTISEVQNAVYNWSKSNFRDNASPLLPVTYTEYSTPTACLGSVAAVLGVVEECGEVARATDKNDVLDGVGDVMVYLCDFAGREGFDLGQVSPSQPAETAGLSTPRKLMSAAGKLCHCVLKRHQRIRGMDDDNAYAAARHEAVAELLWSLDEVLAMVTHETGLRWSLKNALTFTWEKVVAKRNWNADPSQGGGHTHQGG